MTRLGFQCVVMILACAVYLTGALTPLTNRLAEQQFRLLPRPAMGDLLLVEIDPVSLANVGAWPWPRSIHARLLDQLTAAGADAIVMDIDFSSASVAEEDRALAGALARTSATVTFPVFRQHDRGERAGVDTWVESLPSPMFRDHVALASANLHPEADGLVWRAMVADAWGGRRWPTLSSVLSGGAVGGDDPFVIDYGIVLEEIDRLSYFDAMVGNFDPDLVRGRRVLVTATAIELGDIIAVPVHRVLPGGYVQLLAAESILQKRMLAPTPRWLVIAITAGLAFAGVHVFARWNWRRGLIVVIGLMALSLVAGTMAYAGWAQLLDVVPWVVATLLAYGAGLAVRNDEQTARLARQTMDLRRRNAFMSRVAEHAFDALLTTDSSGRIRTINRSALRIFGYTAIQAVGMEIGRICPLPPLAGDAAGLADGYDGSGIIGVGDRVSYRTTGRRADATPIPLDVAVSTLPEDDYATHVFVIRDLSHQKAAEEREAQARTRLAEAVETSPGGFALFDADQRLVLSNAQYRDCFPAAAGALVPGARLRDVVVGESALLDLTADQRSRYVQFWTGRQDDDELSLPDGRWMSIRRRSTSDGGIVAVVTDTTAARQREQDLVRAKIAAEHASAAKSEFLAMISHELRTPLNAVIGFAEMMSMKIFGDLGNLHYEEYVDSIQTSGRHLLELINTILDFNKIDSGMMELKEEQVDIAEMIRRCLVILHPMANEKNLDISLDVESETLFATVDRLLFSKAILNVISNAVKFTHEGGNIRVAALLGRDRDLEVCVSDSGIGLHPDDLTKAFEPFQQIDSALSRQYDGTGLGLPLARGATELHGGDLTLESELGVGTTVTIRLPGTRVCAPMTAAAE